MKQYVYPSLKARIKTEYMIYLLALVFILIADSIGQIEIPMGPGKFILFPIFYALILGIISGPQVTKIVKSKQVKAASKLVIVAICPFIAKLGINAGASLETVVSGIWQSGYDFLCHAAGIASWSEKRSYRSISFY